MDSVFEDVKSVIARLGLSSNKAKDSFFFLPNILRSSFVTFHFLRYLFFFSSTNTLFVFCTALIKASREFFHGASAYR